MHYVGFELRLDERRVLIGGEPATVGARAFDLLAALVERSDRVVSKHELLDTVWPKLVVEENNLQVHIHALRKLLGPAVISTVPGRGYRFTAQSLTAETRRAPPARGAVLGSSGAQDDGEEEASRLQPGVGVSGNLQAHLPPLFGREDEVQALVSLLGKHRLVTITGAAGIGKTRLAEAVAKRMQPQLECGVWLVELAPVVDQDLMLPLVAQALGHQLQGVGAGVAKLVQALHAQAMLLVLDNCEHLVDAVSALAQKLVAELPLLRVLVTSQELLRVPGEQVFKLVPLAVPAADDMRDVGDAECFGAVRLFVERVRAVDRSFVLDEKNVVAVLDVCRRLDGIALAIEMAAARVPLLGIQGLRDRLDERFRVLTGGARVAMRRHQTLRAAMDWSHQLLEVDEQKVFRRLGLFSNGFSLEGAQAVASDDAIDPWQVLDVLAGLLDKSLLLVTEGERPRYRMLESTREYAIEKLAEAGETDVWLGRHAKATRAVLEQAVKERDTDRVWIEMANVRAAFNWAISPNGDAETAVALATRTSMVLMVMGMGDEGMQRLHAVEHLVNDQMPAPLVAQYWRWVARGNVGGGWLPTSRCVAAFLRAETLYRQLKSTRHLHACLRNRAEALLAVSDLTAAQTALDEAESMEYTGCPPADRLRRLRVQGLVYAAAGRYEEALAASRHAFDVALAGNMERYVLILRADMADVQLKLGRAAEAVDQFRTLAAMAAGHARNGRSHAVALAGLCAALLVQGQREAALVVAKEALPLLRRCGLFTANADIFAWILAELGCMRSAMQLIGAADYFQQSREIHRDKIRLQAHSEAIKHLPAEENASEIARWSAEGAALSEDELADVVQTELAKAKLRIGENRMSTG
jgi:predicted ATPase/DNA-binding winged helix-turn-helix (wHTH) protein